MLRRRTIRRGDRIAILAALMISLGGCVACQNLAFYEKAAFADPLMTAEDDISELHMRQKAHYSREAAIGGMGKTAGGGCGCY